MAVPLRLRPVELETFFITSYRRPPSSWKPPYYVDIPPRYGTLIIRFHCCVVVAAVRTSEIKARRRGVAAKRTPVKLSRT